MVQRVNGSLAVSRALGDFVYKQVKNKKPTEQLVSPEPEVSVLERHAEDEFLILACDGIWDVMSNEQVCDFIRSRLKVTESLSQIANEVVDACLYKGSQDNMSIVLVTFPGAQGVDPSAVEADKALDSWIEEQVEALCQLETPTDVEAIREYLKSLNSRPHRFPPGAELYSKTHVIERVWAKHRDKDTGK